MWRPGRDSRYKKTEVKAGLDYESSFGKARPNVTILKLQRTTPCYKRNRAHLCGFYVRGECSRRADCPYRHEMPVTGELSQQNIKDRYYGVNDPVAGEMLSLAAPEDMSIKILSVGAFVECVAECEGMPPSSWFLKRVTLKNTFGVDVEIGLCQSVDSSFLHEKGGRPLGDDHVAILIVNP